jgi:ABC-type transport system involved in cytochrome c biogenesis permease subunit
MFVVIFFLLGLCFGFALRMPGALFAFLIPLGLVLAAADRSAAAIVIGFAVTAIGIMAGILMANRADTPRHPVGGA